MYVVMNVLEVPQEAKNRMADMFGHGAEHMKRVPGFLEFQFLDAADENKQIVYTKWESQEAYEAWRHSEAFAQAHAHERTQGSPATGSKIETYHVTHHS